MTEKFHCQLTACKGACCYEGDFGAPLLDEEREILEQIQNNLEPFLSAESITILESQGSSKYYRGMQSWGTMLQKDGSCVYMYKNAEGIAGCSIEKAYQAGAVNFQKPVSCHLYPVRVKENKAQGFVACNYDRWDICQAACSFGKDQKMPLYRFVKDALIRRFGESFYEQLDAAYQDHFDVPESPANTQA